MITTLLKPSVFMVALCWSFAVTVHAQTLSTNDGLRKTVSVDAFQATEALGGSVTSEGMSAMLTAALVKDGRFVVIERIAAASISAEQTLSQSGVLAPASATKLGQLIGASAIIRGIVTKFEPQASGGGVSLGGLPLSGLFGARAGANTKTSELEIVLRVIDTSTGQVIATSTAKGTAASSTAAVSVTHTGSGRSLDSDAFKNTPIGQAGEDAIKKAVELIATGMQKIGWSALVVDTTDQQIYINAGSNQNMQTGMLLNIYRQGKVLTDPVTSEVLGVDVQKLGSIKIEQVRDRLSIASLVSGEMPARGNLVKRD